MSPNNGLILTEQKNVPRSAIGSKFGRHKVVNKSQNQRAIHNSRLTIYEKEHITDKFTTL